MWMIYQTFPSKMKEILTKIKEEGNKEIVINAFNEIISVDEFDTEKIIANDAKYVIDDFYNNAQINIPHTSGNPELETEEKVEGWEYINYEFEGSYDKALEDIISRVK